MKRKLAYVALPLLLLALIFGVKWRVEHPMMTTLDLQVRQALLEPAKVRFYSNLPEVQYSSENVYHQEFERYINCLHVLPFKYIPRTKSASKIIVFQISFGDNPRKATEFATIAIDAEENKGFLCFFYSRDGEMKYDLHPATIKRWRELLLANPRIGPELRARIKS